MKRHVKTHESTKHDSERIPSSKREQVVGQGRGSEDPRQRLITGSFRSLPRFRRF